MKKAVFIIVLFVLAAGACSKKAMVNDPGLEISHFTVCGWCVGGDSLSVKKNNSLYFSYSSCDIKSGKGTTYATDNADWRALVALLDIQKFRSINLDICNVCADGCDARVTVRQGVISHSISYGDINNPEVAAIKPFLEKLMAIRSEYREKAR